MALNNYYANCFSKLEKKRDEWNDIIMNNPGKLINALYVDLTTNEYPMYHDQRVNTVNDLYVLLHDPYNATINIKPQSSKDVFTKATPKDDLDDYFISKKKSNYFRVFVNDSKLITSDRRIVVNVTNQNSAFAIAQKLIGMMAEKPEDFNIYQFKVFLNTNGTKTKIKDDKIVIYYKSGARTDETTFFDSKGNNIVAEIINLSQLNYSQQFFPFYHIVGLSSGIAWGDEPTIMNESFSSIRCTAMAEMLLKQGELPGDLQKFQESLEAYFTTNNVNPILPYLNLISEKSN
ncbi:MAG: hypothetical protein HRT58_14655 [Crocinitomicaceae bacterium]|nr:hypothetical protein [Flavobacteriales bacterium]NQZ36908.1 hypothetical protein [Crocinitomicaceae bacterium]